MDVRQLEKKPCGYQVSFNGPQVLFGETRQLLKVMIHPHSDGPKHADNLYIKCKQFLVGFPANDVFACFFRCTVLLYQTMGPSETPSVCTVIQQTKDELPFPKNHRGENQDAYQTNCRIANITTLLDSGEVLGI